MITAAEIRKKTERKYVDYLRSVVAGSEFEPSLFQTVPVCVRSPSKVASMFRFGELETRFSEKLRLDIPE